MLFTCEYSQSFLFIDVFIKQTVYEINIIFKDIFLNKFTFESCFLHNKII